MKKVLRGAFVASVAFAACVGFGSTASAVDTDRVDVPDVTDVESSDLNILNNACVLPWFWQGPFNVLVENQDGSYSACNGMGSGMDAEGTNILNNACVLPWFWQGPFNVFLGNQDGEYVACNGATEIPEELEGEITKLLPESQLSELLPEGVLPEGVLPDGAQVLPQSN